MAKQEKLQEEHNKQLKETMDSMMEQNRLNWQRIEQEREATYQQYVAENQELCKKLEQSKQDMEAELEKAKKQWEDGLTDIQTFEQVQSKVYDDFLVKVADMPPPPKTAKPSVAVVGVAGVGKSSLINSLVGGEVTKVGEIDTTKVVCKVYDSEFAEFWDVPGCSEERSYANTKSIMEIKAMHFIIIVYIDRYGTIAKLEKMIRACDVPYVVVRNKIDLITLAKAKKHGIQSREAYLKHLWAEEKKGHGTVPGEGVEGDLLYVSAEEKEGLPELERRIAQARENPELFEPEVAA